ncbi:unnamed protein product [Hymenolepis diminuta]|uniref:Transmembrane protein n=1 Tax=Hymenolepis diminuta TaxID=6216 RepID=A0A158QEX2_HYMDI|nr:unnamed protein product [Hymenolepis diminuta]VUZ42890.1 unnamed protein product [Hymenolepis diminuta]
MIPVRLRASFRCGRVAQAARAWLSHFVCRPSHRIHTHKHSRQAGLSFISPDLHRHALNDLSYSLLLSGSIKHLAAQKQLQYLWKIKTSALLSSSTVSTGLDREEEEEVEFQVEGKPGIIESSGGSADSTEDRLSTCHRALGCLVFVGIWLGFLASLILTFVGIWTLYRNCLTIGVILAIVCLGVAIHNCLRRGDTISAIPIYVRRDSRLSVSCDLEVAEVADEIDGAEVGSGCVSVNGTRSVLNDDQNGEEMQSDDPVHTHSDVEAARTHIIRPRIHRDSAFQCLTRAIITTLTRVGRGGSTSGGGGGVSGGEGFHPAPRNAWNSNFEGHIGWQSALARPDPFYSTSYYR